MLAKEWRLNPGFSVKDPSAFRDRRRPGARHAQAGGTIIEAPGNTGIGWRSPRRQRLRCSFVMTETASSRSCYLKALGADVV